MVDPSINILCLCAVAAYFVGTVPFGLLLTKAAGKGDIRAVGSGNIGATNVLRTGSKKLALITLLLDFGKGYFAVWLSWQLTAMMLALNLDPALGDGTVASIGSRAALYHQTGLISALMVVIGHIFPCWLAFKGGKGVATMFGVAFALSSTLGLICAVAWIATFAITRISSLSALIMLVFFAMGIMAVTPSYWELAVALPLLVAAKHFDNIMRLLHGREHRFELSPKSTNDSAPSDTNA